MELKSLTPLAEWTDMVYTRAATELTPIAGLRWWVELRPPQDPAEGTGVLKLKGRVERQIFEWPCRFDAVAEGIAVTADDMASAADYHISHFKSMVSAHAST
jgi:hypothetical protein